MINYNNRLDIGKFIKTFEKEFDQELRARNGVHHDSRFEDIAIDRILLTGSISQNNKYNGWKREHMAAYRKVASEWAQRVRLRSSRMEVFLEAIAKATLESCGFLKSP